MNEKITFFFRTLHQFNAPMDRKDFSGDRPHDVARVYNHKEAVEFLNTSVVFDKFEINNKLKDSFYTLR